eukprot:UN09520
MGLMREKIKRDKEKEVKKWSLKSFSFLLNIIITLYHCV